jgi:CheY-like chemotaxis protein
MITTEEERERGLRMGAMGVLTKPVKTKEALDETFGRIKSFVEPRTRHLLVVGRDGEARNEVVDLLAGEDVQVMAVGAAPDAFSMLRERRPDVMVLDLDLPGQQDFELVESIGRDDALREIPVIIYAQRELSKQEEQHVKRLGQSMVVKDVRSPERLLDEACLFLHRPVSTLPEPRQRMLERLHETGAVLAGKKVLIVDDDIRNIFAMTCVLEPHKMNIVAAETGKAAIDILQNTPDIDVVLMDIMMPMMDGYDTMRAIRKSGKFRSLPIIALTAKAMKGDREKCIEAGASDYISKPVDTEQLLGMLRVWLYR